jgi:hypothetical protein
VKAQVNDLRFVVVSIFLRVHARFFRIFNRLDPVDGVGATRSSKTRAPPDHRDLSSGRT